MFTPENLEVAMVSFEGPDQYSLAGGLGVRAKEMCRGFAALGFRTTLFFVGDPALPVHEENDGVSLVRCVREISRAYPAGVYEGEAEKVAALQTVLPNQVLDTVIRPAAHRGRVVLVLFEEWQTAELCVRLHHVLFSEGMRDRAILLWNANNTFAFEQLRWPELEAAASLTTVSKYMKHLMWPHHVNPIVIPNGIPEESLRQPSAEAVAAIAAQAGTESLAFKIGRFTPDKRWLQAVHAIADLRRDGLPARLLMRGGIEPHGAEVVARCRELGLGVADWFDPILDAHGVARALAETDGAPVVNLCTFLPEEVIPEIHCAATAVLANSGHEPFGLVGLEAMAAGGVAIVGATGEEYARPYGNAIVIESDRGSEVAGALRGLVERPALAQRLRRAAHRDAAEYAWPKVLEGLLERLRFLAQLQEVDVPEPVTGRPA